MVRGSVQIESSRVSFQINSESISQEPSKKTIALFNLLNIHRSWCDIYITLDEGLKTSCSSGPHSDLWRKSGNILENVGRWATQGRHSQITTDWNPLAADPVRKDVLSSSQESQFSFSSHSTLLVYLAIRVPLNRADCCKLALQICHACTSPLLYQCVALKQWMALTGFPVLEKIHVILLKCMHLYS